VIIASDYIKVAGYKVNIKKSALSLYTSNEQVEFEIKCTILFTLAPQNNEILRYNSNKICTRSVWGKLQNCEEQNKQILLVHR